MYLSSRERERESTLGLVSLLRELKWKGEREIDLILDPLEIHNCLCGTFELKLSTWGRY